METDIWIISANGRHRRRLTNDAATEQNIEWSPTGTEIAYLSAPYGGTGDLFVADRSGRRHRRLTETGGTCEYPTGWSRDGRWVHVSNCVTDARFEIQASSAKRRAPTTPRGTLSPDRRWIAYVTNDSHTNYLYIADADGKNPRLISSEAELGEWSPNGRTLAFEGDARNGCGSSEYRTQIFLIAPEPDSTTPSPRHCISSWERSPTWQPLGR